MNITRMIVVDDMGEPNDAVIPFEKFVEPMVVLGHDPGESGRDGVSELLGAADV